LRKGAVRARADRTAARPLAAAHPGSHAPSLAASHARPHSRPKRALAAELAAPLLEAPRHFGIPLAQLLESPPDLRTAFAQPLLDLARRLGVALAEIPQPFLEQRESLAELLEPLAHHRLHARPNLLGSRLRARPNLRRSRFQARPILLRSRLHTWPTLRSRALLATSLRPQFATALRSRPRPAFRPLGGPLFAEPLAPFGPLDLAGLDARAQLHPRALGFEVGDSVDEPRDGRLIHLFPSENAAQLLLGIAELPADLLGRLARPLEHLAPFGGRRRPFDSRLPPLARTFAIRPAAFGRLRGRADRHAQSARYEQSFQQSCSHSRSPPI
jgi:hypothetical protein